MYPDKKFNIFLYSASLSFKLHSANLSFQLHDVGWNLSWHAKEKCRDYFQSTLLSCARYVILMRRSFQSKINSVSHEKASRFSIYNATQFFLQFRTNPALCLLKIPEILQLRILWELDSGLTGRSLPFLEYAYMLLLKYYLQVTARVGKKGHHLRACSWGRISELGKIRGRHQKEPGLTIWKDIPIMFIIGRVKNVILFNFLKDLFQKS